jgi:hypothetical protein
VPLVVTRPDRYEDWKAWANQVKRDLETWALKQERIAELPVFTQGSLPKANSVPHRVIWVEGTGTGTNFRQGPAVNNGTAWYAVTTSSAF